MRSTRAQSPGERKGELQTNEWVRFRRHDHEVLEFEVLDIVDSCGRKLGDRTKERKRPQWEPHTPDWFVRQMVASDTSEDVRLLRQTANC